MSNKIKISVVDQRVRAVLKLIKATNKSGIDENAPQEILNRPQDREFLRRVAAESIVLLKNDGGILPFDKSKNILVIGPNSKIATISGGGSASLNAYYGISPYDGVVAQATAGVEFAQAIYSHQFLPLLGTHLVDTYGKPGFTLRVYNDPPEVQNRKLVEERHLTDANCFFIDYYHPQKNEIWYADAEGTFVPEESGLYDFGLAVHGTARLYIGGKLLISNFENQKAGSSFLGSGTIEETGSIELEAGQRYNVLVHWGCSKTSSLKSGGVVDFGQGGLRFGCAKRLDPWQGIKDAVELAKNADQVVIFVGLSAEWESEGQDRTSMGLPPYSDDLIRQVLDVNSNAAVVVQSGTPVAMPWINNAKAVLQAWYGGNETGNGIADVLFGAVNPVSGNRTMVKKNQGNS
jgi:beta-glucosidase